MTVNAFTDFIQNGLPGLCDRCGVPCAVEASDNPDARLLKRANVPRGVCASCAATNFIKSTPALLWGIEKNGPEALLIPMIQQQFAAMLAAGNSDSDGSEINWQRVVDNWGLE
jgi:hypothetical protein